MGFIFYLFIYFGSYFVLTISEPNRATQIATAFTTCPNTKLVVSGYSQVSTFSRSFSPPYESSDHKDSNVVS